MLENSTALFITVFICNQFTIFRINRIVYRTIRCISYFLLVKQKSIEVKVLSL